MLNNAFHYWLIINTSLRYYSKTGCDGMGICCEKKTMIGWEMYKVWSGGFQTKR